MNKKWSESSDREMLEALVNKAEQLGRTPVSTECKASTETCPGACVIVRRFGTWNEALDLAGLPLNRTRTEKGKRPYASHDLPIEERLLRNCAVFGCWHWLGGLDSGGYGQIDFDGRKANTHRIAYEVWVGKIEPGMHIHHKCEVRACINPGHLEVVTPLEHAKRHKELRNNAKLSAQ